MIRSLLLTVLVAPLLLLPSLASAKVDKFHRLSPMTGLSLTLPDGWAACDAESNRALGNQSARPLPVQQICASGLNQPGDLLLMGFNEAQPVLLYAHRASQALFPPAMFVGASPEVMQAMSASVCKHGDVGINGGLEDCDLRVVQVSGRPAVVGTAVEAVRRNLAVQFYAVSMRAGTMIFVFVTPSSMDAPTAQEIRGIMSTVHVAADPPPPAGTVTLTPAPGVSIAVPRSWLACDAANNALLGGAADAYSLRRDGCENPPPAEEKLRVVALDGSNAQFVGIAMSPTDVTADEWASSLSDSQLAATRDRDCGFVAESISSADAKTTVSDCATSAGSVSGHPAKIVSYRTRAPDEDGNMIYHSFVRATLFVVNGQIGEVAQWSAGIVEPTISAASDAIAASVTVQ
jgi:hypothetical protein